MRAPGAAREEKQHHHTLQGGEEGGEHQELRGGKRGISDRQRERERSRRRKGSVCGEQLALWHWRSGDANWQGESVTLWAGEVPL